MTAATQRALSLLLGLALCVPVLRMLVEDALPPTQAVLRCTTALVLSRLGVAGLSALLSAYEPASADSGVGSAAALASDTVGGALGSGDRRSADG